MKTNQKTFDCIAFKRQAQEEIYQAIKDLPVEEQIAYYRRRVESGPFAELLRKLKSRGQSPTRHNS